MPVTIGKITNIKLGSFLQGTVNAFDIGTVTLHETASGADWVFYLWNSRADAPAVVAQQVVAERVQVPIAVG